MSQNPVDLLPELILLIGAVITLVIGLFASRQRQGAVGLVAATAVVASLGAAAWQWAGPPRMAFDDSYRVDAITSAVRVIVAVALLLLLPLLRHQFRDHPRETEAYVLLLLAGLGAISLAGSNDLLLLAGAYSLASVPLYALVGFGKDAAGTEAALKYYLMGALFGLLLLAGIILLFGLAGSTAYSALNTGLRTAPQGALVVGVVAVVVGLAFKGGAVPSHFWVPDVTDGAPTAVAALVTTVPKVGALAALYRLFSQPLQDAPVNWRLLLAAIAVASMTLGNLAAFFQAKPKRLLAYSTISQVGYLLLPVVVAGKATGAPAALLYYLAGYTITNVGAFAVVAALPVGWSITDYRGLARRRPGLALALVTCLLGLVGTPPLAVFVGKLAAFNVAIAGDYTWLAVVTAINTVASVFYYLRWIAPAFTPAPPGSHTCLPRAVLPLAVAYLAASGSVAFGALSGFALAGGGPLG